MNSKSYDEDRVCTAKAVCKCLADFAEDTHARAGAGVAIDAFKQPERGAVAATGTSLPRRTTKPLQAWDRRRKRAIAATRKELNAQ